MKSKEPRSNGSPETSWSALTPQVIATHADNVNCILLGYYLNQVIGTYLPVTNYKIFGQEADKLGCSALATIASCSIMSSFNYLNSKLSDVLSNRFEISSSAVKATTQILGMAAIGSVSGYDPWIAGAIALTTIVNSYYLTKNAAPNTTSTDRKKTLKETFVGSAIGSAMGFSMKYIARSVLASCKIPPLPAKLFDVLFSSAAGLHQKLTQATAAKLYPMQGSHETGGRLLPSNARSTGSHKKPLLPSKKKSKSPKRGRA